MLAGLALGMVERPLAADAISKAYGTSGVSLPLYASDKTSPQRLDHLFKLHDDSLAPTLRIISPRPGQRVRFGSADAVVVSGTAADNFGVIGVDIYPHEGASAGLRLPATVTPGVKSGMVNWTCTVPVDPERNTVSVYAYDRQGNTSKEARLVFTFVKLATLLQASVEGDGAIQSTVPGTRQVELGKPYLFTPWPKPGNALTYWTADVGDGHGVTASTGNLLRIVPAGDVRVTAHFAPIPYRTRSGVFNGVLYTYTINSDPTSSSSQAFGFFTLKLTKSGFFTGRLTYRGASRALAGQLDRNGSAQITVSAGAQALTVVLGLDFTTPVADDLQVTVLTRDGFASGFTRGGKVAGTLGHYTALLSLPPPSLASPARPGNLGGQGYLALTAAPSGNVRIVGALPDGAKVSAASTLQTISTAAYDPLTGDPLFEPASGLPLYTIEPVLPVFAAVPPGASALDGMLYLDPLGFQSENMMHWRRVATGAGVFPDGIDLDLPVALSSYTPPARNAELAPFGGAWPGGTITIVSPLDGRALFTQGFALDVQNHLTLSPPVQARATLAFDLTTGIFTGSFSLPASPRAQPFGGVLSQDGGSGAGVSPGATESDAVTLTLGSGQ